MFLRMPLLLDGEEFEILSRPYVVELYSEDLTVAFLRRFLDEPVNRQALREVVNQLRPGGNVRALDDEEILRQVARRVVMGELKIVRRLRKHWIRATPPDEAAVTPLAAEQAAQAERPAAPPPEPAPAPAPPPEVVSVLPADLDQVAQARTLEQAAAAGTPLCET